jgi:hypothetical protein
MSDQSRWTRPAGEHGDDPAERDAELRDPEQARLLAEQRAVSHDQEATGEQGTSADQPGVDAEGYPGESVLEDQPATESPD